MANDRCLSLESLSWTKEPLIVIWLCFVLCLQKLLGCQKTHLMALFHFSCLTVAPPWPKMNAEDTCIFPHSAAHQSGPLHQQRLLWWREHPMIKGEACNRQPCCRLLKPPQRAAVVTQPARPAEWASNDSSCETLALEFFRIEPGSHFEAALLVEVVCYLML